VARSASRKAEDILALPAVSPAEVLPPVEPRTIRHHQPASYVDTSGRVFQFPKMDLDEVEMMASVGMSTKQIADALHLAPSQFGKMMQSDPVVKEAVDRGVARGVKIITDSLFQNAVKGNVAAQIFWLKNKAAWKDTQELEQRIESTHKMSFEDAVSALKAAGIDPSKV
jgi:hypothetical protein